jgi:hypothetical protein
MRPAYEEARLHLVLLFWFTGASPGRMDVVLTCTRHPGSDRGGLCEDRVPCSERRVLRGTLNVECLNAGLPLVLCSDYLRVFHRSNGCTVYTP